MSRHTVKHPFTPSLTIVYGYDGPLSEYFCQVSDEYSKENVVIFHTNQQASVIEKMSEFGLSDHPHFLDICLDLPIND